MPAAHEARVEPSEPKITRVAQTEPKITRAAHTGMKIPMAEQKTTTTEQRELKTFRVVFSDHPETRASTINTKVMFKYITLLPSQKIMLTQAKSQNLAMDMEPWAEHGQSQSPPPD